MSLRFRECRRLCIWHNARIAIAGLRTVVAILLWSALATSASAIDISEVRWGFNGKVAPHRFNVLSVLVNNTTPKQFTEKIRLRKRLGGAGLVDAEIVEEVTVTPGALKWVQFYPYITSENRRGGAIGETWFLSYPGDGGGYGYPVPEPHMAKYQRVILDDPNSISARGGAIKFHLPDSLFPPFVTATDALQLVAIDHVPRWEESRRQSFLDWLYLGGTAVVLHDSSGKFPDFAESLNILKSPLDEQMYGAGRILKVPVSRSLFGDSELLQVCAGLPKNFVSPNALEKTDDIVDRGEESKPADPNEIYNNNYSEGNDPFKSNSRMWSRIPDGRGILT